MPSRAFHLASVLFMFAIPARADLAADVARAVEPYVVARDFAGVIGVARGGEPVHIGGYGMASVELGVPHEPDHLFMIGSVSKQFTAAAILLLEEAGKLSTDDPVARHLPDFPHERVTIEQLIHHSGGVVDIYSLDLFGKTEGLSGNFDEVLAAIYAEPLTHEPGTTFLYSNGGYSLLAAVIEAASGRSYGDFLRERIFDPLGMTDTEHDGGPARARRVPGYDPFGARDLEPVVAPASAFSKGSGSLWSSARDLITWTHALHNGGVLSGASYEKMVEPTSQAYAYGVSVFNRFGRRVVGHDGRITGFSSDLAHYLDDDLTVVVLSNVQSVARDEIRVHVAAAALDEPIPDITMRRYADDARRTLDPLTGLYRFTPTLLVRVIDRDGRLLAKANEGSYTELVAVDDTFWFSRALYATVRFAVNEAGVADTMFWGDESRQWPGPRAN